MKLAKLATISSGINERRNPQGTVFYLGGSDFVQPHQLNPLLKPSVVMSSKLQKHFLNKGDVLVLAKGHNGFLAHSYKRIKQPAVASSIFMVLRNINPIVLPEYLAWYINLKSTQEVLISQSRGSALPAINKKILGALDVKLTDLENQKRIVALDSLKNQEQELMMKLQNLRTIKLEYLLKSKIQ